MQTLPPSGVIQQENVPWSRQPPEPSARGRACVKSEDMAPEAIYEVRTLQVLLWLSLCLYGKCDSISGSEQKEGMLWLMAGLSCFRMRDVNRLLCCYQLFQTEPQNVYTQHQSPSHIGDTTRLGLLWTDLRMGRQQKEEGQVKGSF